jgi:hypothetical protein
MDGRAMCENFFLGSETATRDLPVPDKNMWSHEPNQNRRRALKQAYQFTRAIEEDIKTANKAGIKPLIVSIGLDAWASDTVKILAWLQTGPGTFSLMLRLPSLYHGLSKEHVTLDNGVYWGTYEPDMIRKSLEMGGGLDEATDNLIAAWRKIQGLKNAARGLRSGRNHVKPNNATPTA